MADEKRVWSPPQMVWSALLAIVAWSALGFSWFGHGFDWTTQTGAKRMTEAVLMDHLSGICVAQARAGAGATASLKNLGEVGQWDRREFVERKGWATMPGSESPVGGVADLCVSKLLHT
jgi:hypothetical protein